VAGGRESGRRVIGTAEISRTKGGALADYEVELCEKASRASELDGCAAYA